MGEGKAKTIIFEAELATVIIAFALWRSWLNGRPVVFYIDNNSARDVAISGVSRKQCWQGAGGPAAHRGKLCLKHTHGFARVPSPANVADKPSSLRLKGVFCWEGVVFVHSCAPPVESCHASWPKLLAMRPLNRAAESISVMSLQSLQTGPLNRPTTEAYRALRLQVPMPGTWISKAWIESGDVDRIHPRGRPRSALQNVLSLLWPLHRFSKPRRPVLDPQRASESEQPVYACTSSCSA